MKTNRHWHKEGKQWRLSIGQILPAHFAISGQTG
jgi:hypothetical protein